VVHFEDRPAVDGGSGGGGGGGGGGGHTERRACPRLPRNARALQHHAAIR
jgi:hypothetical protein